MIDGGPCIEHRVCRLMRLRRRRLWRSALLLLLLLLQGDGLHTGCCQRHCTLHIGGGL